MQLLMGRNGTFVAVPSGVVERCSLATNGTLCILGMPHKDAAFESNGRNFQYSDSDRFSDFRSFSNVFCSSNSIFVLGFRRL